MEETEWIKCSVCKLFNEDNFSYIYVTSNNLPKVCDWIIVDGELNRVGTDKYQTNVSYSVKPELVIGTNDPGLCEDAGKLSKKFIEDYYRNPEIKKVYVEHKDLNKGWKELANHGRFGSTVVYSNFQPIIDTVDDTIHCSVEPNPIIKTLLIKYPELKKDLTNYCETAFLAGYANGSLPVDKILRILKEWIKDNI